MTDDPTPPPDVRNMSKAEYRIAKEQMLRTANQQRMAADEARNITAAIARIEKGNFEK